MRRVCIALLPALAALAIARPAAAQQKYDDLLKRGMAFMISEERNLYKAIRAFEQAIKLNAKRHEAYRDLGRVYRWQQREEGAMRMLRKAVRIQPRDGVAHFFLGLLFNKRGATPQELELALKHFNEALGLVSATLRIQTYNVKSQCWQQLASVHEKLRAPDAARKALIKAHEFLPKEKRPIEKLARMAERAGRLDDAKKWYQKLLKLEPDSKKFKEKVVNTQNKQALGERGKVELECGVRWIEVGKTLPADAISFRGYNSKRKIVRFDQHWEVSGGLQLVKSHPLTIKAKDKPSTEEFIYLTDKQTGLSTKVMVMVVGKPVKLKLSPDRIVRNPGTPVNVTLIGIDSAGNEFGMSDVKWSFRLKGQETESTLFKAVPGQGFAYRIEIPADAEEGSYSVSARKGTQSVEGMLEVYRYTKPKVGKAWKDDFKKAFEQGTADKQPIMMYLWLVNSPSCVTFETKVLADKQIRADLQGVVPLRLDAWEIAERAQLYKLKGIPSVLFFTPRGVYIDRLSGDIDKDKLHKMLTGIGARSKSKDAEYQALLDAVTAKPEDILAREKLGKFLGDHFLLREALEHYYKALTFKGDAERLSQIRLFAAYIELRYRNFEAAQTLYDKVLKESSDKKKKAIAGFYLGSCLFYGLRQTKEARRVWRKVVKDHPRSDYAKRARDMLEKKR